MHYVTSAIQTISHTKFRSVFWHYVLLICRHTSIIAIVGGSDLFCATIYNFARRHSVICFNMDVFNSMNRTSRNFQPVV